MGESFEVHRTLLERLAYRMLGSRMDAEDIVQDTFLRFERAAVSPDNLRAWLFRCCVRLCMDRLKSAQRTRESYIGPWLPEPFVEAEQASRAELDETLTLALMVVLERLTPAERAAFILHDVFSYDFAEVSEVLGKTEANCRKLASRARQQVAGGRPSLPLNQAEHERITRHFFDALKHGDISALEAVLAEQVVLTTDGGGKVAAARRPIVGRPAVARFLTRVRAGAPPSVLVPRWFNGALGRLAYFDGTPQGAFQLDVRGGLVVGVFIIRNPDKLSSFAPF